jgi:hypothetical protein
VVVVHKDDGAGLNIDRIREKASELGLRPERDLPQDWVQLIFHSGFSTKQQVTQISGRVVGLDAVRALFKKIGGSIELRLTRRLSPDENKYAFEFIIALAPELFTELTIEDEKRSLAI